MNFHVTESQFVQWVKVSKTILVSDVDTLFEDPVGQIYCMVVTCLDVCIIYFISCDCIMNTEEGIERLATLSTQDTGRRKTKQNDKNTI